MAVWKLSPLAFKLWIDCQNVKFNGVDKRQLTIEGKNLFHDAEVESSKVDDAIVDARFIIDWLGVEVKAMDIQL